MDRYGISSGGKAKPKDCLVKQKTAFIIPYRNRESHLITWLSHLHPVLMRQQLDYQIFVVEQVDKHPFNRAAVMNAGFLETMRMDNFTCYVFHDVDMVPETDLAVYNCPPSAQEMVHMAVSVSRWKYRLTYTNYLGGIVLMSPDTFVTIGGFSNSFWGWGGEDDDLYCRVTRNNISIVRYLDLGEKNVTNCSLRRPPGRIARFRMLKHDLVQQNPELSELNELSKDNKLENDGVDSLQYDLKKIEEFSLFTKIKINLAAPKKVNK